MKNILITGSSDGIGRAVAIEFAKRIPSRFVLISRNIEKLEKLKLLLEELGSQAYIFQCDVAIPEEFISTINTLKEKFNSIDIALLNAGISQNKWILEEGYPDVLQSTYQTNVIAVGIGLHYIGNLMKSIGGIIAIVSSLADSRGYPSSSAYSSSKSAVTKISEAGRIELKQYGIKVITIKPGFVRTNMTAKNKFPMPFLMDVENAAKIIVDGLLKGKTKINFPLPMVLLTKLIECIPDKVYEFFASKYKPNQ